LNNLLYANLKLRRLIREYAKLQRRAKELLKGTADGTGSVHNEAPSEEDIHQLQMELAHQISLLQYGYPLIAKISNPPGAGAIGLEGSQGLWAVGTQAPGLGDSEWPRTARVYSSAQTYYGKDISENGSNTSLPWIFRMLLIAMSYLMAHKNETMICVLLLIALTNGLSAFRKHR
jgi:hypothetical protein